MDGVLISNRFFTTYYLDEVIKELKEIDVYINRGDLLREIFNLFNLMLISENRDNRVKAFDWDELIKIFFNKYELKWTNKIEEFYNSPNLKNYVHLYSDVENILEWLILKGYQLSIISNGLSKYQNRVLKVLNIDTYFKNIILPDHVNDIKPRPIIFKYAISKCKNISKNECENFIFIGDSLYFDIYGANLCNFKSVLLIRSLNAKLKKLSIKERTKKFNEHKRILKYLKKDLLLSRFDLNTIDINLIKPDLVIYSLKELKSIL